MMTQNQVIIDSAREIDLVCQDMGDLGRPGVFQVAVFKFIFLLNHERYNHEMQKLHLERTTD